MVEEIIKKLNSLNAMDVEILKMKLAEFETENSFYFMMLNTAMDNFLNGVAVKAEIL